MLPKGWTKIFKQLSFENARKECCSQGGHALQPSDPTTKHLQAGHPEMEVTRKSRVFSQSQALGFCSSASAEWAGGSFQDAKRKHSSGTHPALGPRSLNPAASAWLTQHQGLGSQLMFPDQDNTFVTPI